MTPLFKAFEFNTGCYGLVLKDGTRYDGKSQDDQSTSYAVINENFFTGIRHHKCGMITNTMVHFKDVELIRPIDEPDLEDGMMLDIRTFGLSKDALFNVFETFSPIMQNYGSDHLMYFKVTQKEPA